MSRNNCLSLKNDGLVLSGYHKKLKTMKKKYFVLFKETSTNVARLEYYDSEKKFKQGLDPKRIIKLKNCFNINRRLDTKYNFVLALSTRDGGFGIVLDNENEMRKWMEILLSLQRQSTKYLEPSYPLFEHVWQVNVQKKGIAEEKGILGNYHVCLTSKSLTFISIGPEKTIAGDMRILSVEFLLTTIRRCGDSQCFFYMEVGRQSVIGQGELWMETDDTLIAQNMHKMILSAMSLKTESHINLVQMCQGRFEINSEPMRKRSSSANEASKPINVMHIQNQNSNENKNIHSFQSSPLVPSFGRERCDSLPTRNRNTNEYCNQSYASLNSFRCNTISGLRSFTIQRHSNSPPISTPAACSESEESSISVDELDDSGTFIPYRFNSRTSEGVIPEENTDDVNAIDVKCNNFDKKSDIAQENYVSMAPIKLKNENDLNKAFKMQFNTDKEAQRIFSVHDLHGLNYDFPEHLSDRLSKDMEIDTEYPLERPARAYSIGSKTDSIKSKGLGNIFETHQNAIRVRAFSVGSRAKIPRCDLQHGVLFSRSGLENTSSNHFFDRSDSRFNKDAQVCAMRDKKSISAPLLNHKSRFNVDHMSDLMEIDFSKMTRTYPKNSSAMLLQLSKPIPNFKLSTMSSSIKNYSSELYSKNVSNLDQKTLPPVDTGYLEMKPLGTTVPNSSQQTSNNARSNTSCASSLTTDNLDIQLKSIALDNKANIFMNLDKSLLISTIPNESQHNIVNASIIVDQCETKYSKSSLNHPENSSSMKKNLGEINNKPMLNHSSDCEFCKNTAINDIEITQKCENAERMQTENNANYFRNNSFCYNISSSDFSLTKRDQMSLSAARKLTHSISDEEHISREKNSGWLLTSGNVGYKILQIKSDSSLQSSRVIHRPSQSKLQKQQINEQNQSNHVNLEEKVNKIDTHQVSDHSKLLAVDVLSQSASLREQKLNYASLEFPQCAKEFSKKITNFESHITETPHPNSYAKIDFEH